MPSIEQGGRKEGALYGLSCWFAKVRLTVRLPAPYKQKAPLSQGFSLKLNRHEAG
jgi:hypothetical protein